MSSVNLLVPWSGAQVAIAGLLVLFGLGLLGLAATTDRGEATAATVVAVVPDGTADVAAGGTSDTVSWIDEPFVGQEVEARLVDGRVVPPPAVTWVPAAFLAAVWFACAAVLVHRALPTRGMGRSQRAAIRAAAAGQPVRPVLLTEVRMAGQGRTVVPWLSVAEEETGRHLGWLQAPRLNVQFDPRAMRVLVGELDGPVALEDEGRQLRLLPSSALVEAPEPTPWSASLVHAFGWDRVAGSPPSPPSAPSIGATDRIHVSQLPDPEAGRSHRIAAPVLVAAAAAGVRNRTVALATIIIFGGSAIVALARGGPSGWVQLSATIVVVSVARLWSHRRGLADLRAAVSRSMPELVGLPRIAEGILLQFASSLPTAPPGEPGPPS